MSLGSVCQKSRKVFGTFDNIVLMQYCFDIIFDNIGLVLMIFDIVNIEGYI